MKKTTWLTSLCSALLTPGCITVQLEPPTGCTCAAAQEPNREAASPARCETPELLDLASIPVVPEANESFHRHQVPIAGNPFCESFRSKDGSLFVEQERLGDFTLELLP